MLTTIADLVSDKRIKFKAAALVKTDSLFDIVENTEVQKLSKEQVLIKIFYSGICHSQTMEVTGAR